MIDALTIALHLSFTSDTSGYGSVRKPSPALLIDALTHSFFYLLSNLILIHVLTLHVATCELEHGFILAQVIIVS